LHSTTTTEPGIFLDKDKKLYRDQYSQLWVDSGIAAKALDVTQKHLQKSVRAGNCTVRVQRIGHLLRFSAKDLDILADGKEAE